MNSQDLYTAWSRHVQASASPMAEQVSQNFVDVALRFHDRILSNQVLRTMVLDMDAEYGKLSPLGAMSNIGQIMQKTKSPEQLHWVMATILDLMKTNECSPKDFTVRSLATCLD